MKTIELLDQKLLPEDRIRRMPNKYADEEVLMGRAKFIPKSVWKTKVRNPKTEVEAREKARLAAQAKKEQQQKKQQDRVPKDKQHFKKGKKYERRAQTPPTTPDRSKS